MKYFSVIQKHSFELILGMRYPGIQSVHITV